jgi:hypothetical protein
MKPLTIKRIDNQKNNQKEEAALSNNHHILTLVFIGWRLISEMGIRLIKPKSSILYHFEVETDV